jgi:hypothetical protein
VILLDLEAQRAAWRDQLIAIDRAVDELEADPG